MRTIVFLLGTALVGAPFSVGAGPSLPMTQAEPESQAVTLRPAPLWVSSGTVSPDGRTLVVVDAMRSAVDRYDLSTVDPQHPEVVRVDRLTARETDLGESFRPSRIQRTNGRYLLQVEDTIYPIEERAGRFLGLHRDQALTQQDFLDVTNVAVRPDAEIGGLYRWSAGDTGVFAYVDVKRAEDDWTSGFAWIPKQDPSAFELVYEVPLGSKARQYHLLLEPLIAIVGETFYFLVYQDEPELYRFHPSEGVERLGVVPEQYRYLPELPSTLGPTTAAACYRALEQARMPAGLLSQGDALYLLTREPAQPPGKTLWKIHRLDENGKSTAYRKLSTDALHLTVVAGPAIWVAIERGTVGDYLKQDNSKALIISAKWFEQPTPDRGVGDP